MKKIGNKLNSLFYKKQTKENGKSKNVTYTISKTLSMSGFVFIVFTGINAFISLNWMVGIISIIIAMAFGAIAVDIIADEKG